MLVKCGNFNCKFNVKCECSLDIITLIVDRSLLINSVLCIAAEQKNEAAKPLDLETAGGVPEAEPKDKSAQPLDLETAWGVPEKDLPEQPTVPWGLNLNKEGQIIDSKGQVINMLDGEVLQE